MSIKTILTCIPIEEVPDVLKFLILDFMGRNGDNKLYLSCAFVSKHINVINTEWFARSDHVVETTRICISNKLSTLDTFINLHQKIEYEGGDEFCQARRELRNIRQCILGTLKQNMHRRRHLYIRF